jgi:hypothetical protein
MARIATEMSGVNCVADTVFHDAAHSTPATAEKNPDTARTASFTAGGLTPNAALARSLSRTATNRRPGLDRRNAAPMSTATATTASET